MFCKYCGQHIDKDSSFCTACGKDISPQDSDKPKIKTLVEKIMKPKEQKQDDGIPKLIEIINISGDRLSLKEYWISVLATYTSFLPILALGFLMYDVPVFETLITVLMYVWGLFLICVSINNCVRRLHDMNINGWWTVAVFLIPLFSLALILTPGNKDHNRFGDTPPKRARTLKFIFLDRKDNELLSSSTILTIFGLLFVSIFILFVSG